MGHRRNDRPRTALIVDDDPIFTTLAAETLKQAGFLTQVASEASDALALVMEANPDIVLLDVELPDGQGFDVCERIRAIPAFTDLPIVMVTGKHDTASIERAYQAGATDFINKPVLWGTLPHRLEFILRAHDTMRALRVSERKNRAMLQALPDAIYIINASGTVIDHMSPGTALGETRPIGRSIGEVLPDDAALATYSFISGAPETGALVTHDFFTKPGPKGEGACELRVLAQMEGTFLLILRDTSERKQAEDRIEYLAYFDTLTGLPNRQMLKRDVDRALLQAQRQRSGAALLYLDLDRFKRVNDTLGHATGDTLLREVAGRLQAALQLSSHRSEARGSDMVARLGGDEFVILVTDAEDELHVSAVVTRIEQALSEPFVCDGHRLLITPSIGIALYPQDGSDVDDLLVKADMAMYRAKDRGRNGHSFYGETMAVKALGRLQMEGDLHRAIEEGEFQLHFQPKMELAHGRVIGVEALLRWKHPAQGMIPPDRFIPVAEETGLIAPIGDWVIEEACRQLKAWEGGPMAHLTMAVNVSVQQFAKDSFVESVLRALWHHGIMGQRLELEITESVLMRDVEATRNALQRLGAVGLRLSIDDFGTGYSSLGYLRQFPVNNLKIDRSFVANLPAGTDSVAICGAILAMARELKLTVIAEGVETQAQFDFLRAHGCDQAQGYLISKPVSSDAFTGVLAGIAALNLVAGGSPGTRPDFQSRQGTA